MSDFTLFTSESVTEGHPDKLADQISALRTSLSASALGHDQTGHELASLAAHIQQVAREADAITAARIEVDTLLHQPQAITTVPPVNETRPQPVRR